MVTVYLPQDTKDEETGLFYKTWEGPEGVPLGDDIVYVAPPKDILYPKWDKRKGFWVEDKDSIIVYLKEKMNNSEDESNQKLEMLEMAIMDLADIALGGV